MDETFTTLIQDVLRFRDEREWGQFHTPKNLAAALAIEAAELQETMLWKSDAEVTAMLASPEREKVEHELADILIYTLLLSAVAGISPTEAIRAKLAHNDAKYPVASSRGKATKYTRLPE